MKNTLDAMWVTGINKDWKVNNILKDLYIDNAFVLFVCVCVCACVYEPTNKYSYGALVIPWFLRMYDVIMHKRVSINWFNTL